MAIVQSINSAHQFREAFRLAGRNNQFSYEGLEALFDYLEEVSEEDDIELDVVALCCEYSEDSIEDLIESYSIDVSDAEGDEDEIQAIVREYLHDNTSVCGEVSGGFVYAAF